MRIIITITMLLALVAAACAADKPTVAPHHNITVTRGRPWAMVVKFAFVEPAKPDQSKNQYIGYVGNGPPLGPRGLVASMATEASTIDPRGLLLSLSADQTAAIGPGNRWALILIPPLGPALLLADGTVEVQK